MAPKRVMRRKQSFLFVLLVAATSAGLTAGPVESSKDVPVVQTPPEKPWSFDLVSYGWMSGVNGTISIGAQTADVDVPFTEVLKHLDMGVMMAAELRYKRWSFTGDFIYARLHDDIAPPAGILFSGTHEVLKETIITLE